VLLCGLVELNYRLSMWLARMALATRYVAHLLGFKRHECTDEAL
jgi:hypothetical protein